jgi:hypothetical protein
MPERKDIWLENMRVGNFEEAWKHSDKVLKSGINRDYIDTPRHFQLIWDGTPLEGRRVLVRCYHGLGDTIMFIRYIPMLRKIASEVIVWAQPKLLELLSTVDGIDMLIPLHDGIPQAEYDVDVELMELPYFFRTTLSSIPAEVPYLHTSPIPLSRSSRELNAGLVWQAGDWDQGRGIDFNILEPLFEIPGIRFYILQDQAEMAGWREGHGIHPGKRSFSEHAGIIKWLDLLISVDTMPAHLAGALNVPVWLLLQAEADWRWMVNRDDSPWYPSMKLFRQEQQGEWETVINKVASDLKLLVITRA